jgi:hypothetical protein
MIRIPVLFCDRRMLGLGQLLHDLHVLLHASGAISAFPDRPKTRRSRVVVGEGKSRLREGAF